MIDMIDLRQAIVFNSPRDIADWPVTGRITEMQIHPSRSPNEGCSFVFDQADRWPTTAENMPSGMGGLQYTVWPVVRINGQWVTSGIIEMWRGRPNTGSPPSKLGEDWAYDGRWGPMAGYMPAVGEQMGFFLSAGDARGVGTVTSVRERTAVVLINLPANDEGTFTFPDSEPIPTPVPTPDPPPVPVPPPAPGGCPCDARLAVIEAKLELVGNAIEAMLTAIATAQAPSYTGRIFGAAFTLTPVAPKKENR
jgi:hypothetical protein